MEENENAKYCIKFAVKWASIAKAAGNLGDKRIAQVSAQQSVYYVAQALKYLAISGQFDQLTSVSTEPQ